MNQADRSCIRKAVENSLRGRSRCPCERKNPRVLCSLLAAGAMWTASPFVNVPVLRADEPLEMPLPLFADEAAPPPRETAPPPRIEIDPAAEKQKRFEELMNQVDELSRLLPRLQMPAESADGETAGAAVSVPNSLPGTVEVPQPLPEFTLTDPEQTPAEPGAESDRDSGTDARTGIPGDPGSPDSVELAAPAGEASGLGDPEFLTADVNGPIDRFALAVSLFGAGERELCLRVLKETDLSLLDPESQLWCEYMQACCHRQLGQLDEARRIYRRILAARNPGWIGDLSKWWQEEVDQKARLRADSDRLAQVLESWEQEINELSRSTD